MDYIIEKDIPVNDDARIMWAVTVGELGVVESGAGWSVR